MKKCLSFVLIVLAFITALWMCWKFFHTATQMAPMPNTQAQQVTHKVPSLTRSSETHMAPDEHNPSTSTDEARVEAFDALTDRWRDETKVFATADDVEQFCMRFKQIPSSRQEECLQRALNLIGDEQVLLLAGLLFDKTLPKPLVELVFNDVLNRSEAVKMPLLKRIFTDKSHPCWADVAWILDVTDSVPKAAHKTHN